MLCVDDMEDGGWRHKCRVHARNCKRFYTRRNRLVPSLCKCCASAVCTSVCGQCVVSVSTVSSGSSRTLLWNAHTHACASSCTLVRYIGIFSMGVYARVRVHCVRRIVAPASGSLPVNGWSRGGGKWETGRSRSALLCPSDSSEPLEPARDREPLPLPEPGADAAGLVTRWSAAPSRAPVLALEEIYGPLASPGAAHAASAAGFSAPAGASGIVSFGGVV